MRNSLILNMAKTRLRNYIVKLLQEKGALTTHEVHAAVKKKYTFHNPCTNEIGALLGRTKGIKKVGMYEEYSTKKRVRCAVWEYKD